MNLPSTSLLSLTRESSCTGVSREQSQAQPRPLKHANGHTGQAATHTCHGAQLVRRALGWVAAAIIGTTAQPGNFLGSEGAGKRCGLFWLQPPCVPEDLLPVAACAQVWTPSQRRFYRQSWGTVPSSYQHILQLHESCFTFDPEPIISCTYNSSLRMHTCTALHVYKMGILETQES